MVLKFQSININNEYKPVSFRETKVEGFLPDNDVQYNTSGHPKILNEQIDVYGKTYKLVFGNLHEHTNNSNCWPAGTDSTFHDDYRFGMFSEGYDFVAITDHTASTNEIYWRKTIRMADFYNEPDYFVGLPATEWTLISNKDYDGIETGAGHYNIIFASAEDARKLIRNKHELYFARCPETRLAPDLWKFLRKDKINCVTIPHHPADIMHPVDWNVTDEEFVSVVEIFQCRGNDEYLGCPRDINLQRHKKLGPKEGYVDVALRDKKHKMGFIGSGDHNNMGVGLAALWVKELSQKGIIEALKSRRCFATTGDKIILDFRVNGHISDTVVKTKNAPELAIHIKAQRELENVEILRNSMVIKEYKITNGSLVFNETFIDGNYQNETDVLYYYIRATQQNNEIAWSSPIWIMLC
jgi:hypothetical protein